jgi:hypothetical protein
VSRSREDVAGGEDEWKEGKERKRTHTGNGNDHISVHLRDPRQRQLSASAPLRLRHGLESLDELEVVFPVLLRDARKHTVTTHVSVGLEVGGRAEATGEDAGTERGVGEDLDAEFFAGIEDAGTLWDVKATEGVSKDRWKSGCMRRGKERKREGRERTSRPVSNGENSSSTKSILAILAARRRVLADICEGSRRQRESQMGRGKRLWSSKEEKGKEGKTRERNARPRDR